MHGLVSLYASGGAIIQTCSSKASWAIVPDVPVSATSAKQVAIVASEILARARTVRFDRMRTSETVVSRSLLEYPQESHDGTHTSIPLYAFISYGNVVKFSSMPLRVSRRPAYFPANGCFYRLWKCFKRSRERSRDTCDVIHATLQSCEYQLR